MARSGVGLVTSGHFRPEAVTAAPRLSLTSVTRRPGAVISTVGISTVGISTVGTVVGEEAHR